MMLFQPLADAIDGVLLAHPKECVFKKNARNNIYDAVIKHISAPDELLIDAFFDAVIANELYCPHEGINRMPLL